MIRASHCTAAVVAAWIGVTCPEVRAQSATAEALFRDGRNLIRAGKLAAGCDKLAASERLESSIGTLLNLGDCREKLGKLASAWAAFRKAEAMARRSGSDDRRQAEAGRRAEALEPRLSNLVIDVAHRADGEVVRRDAEIVDPAEWNTPLPVDPGHYTIAAEAPGHAPWRTTIAIEPGATRRVVAVPGLTPIEPPAPVTTAAPWPPPRPEMVQRAPAPPPHRTWTATRAVSATLAVAGTGAVGTGIYFGLRSRDLAGSASGHCPGTVCNDPEGLRLNQDAKTAASRANVLYIAGGAALVGAAVLWLVGAPGEVAVVPIAAGARAGDPVGLAIAGRL